MSLRQKTHVADNMHTPKQDLSLKNGSISITHRKRDDLLGSVSSSIDPSVAFPHASRNEFVQARYRTASVAPQLSNRGKISPPPVGRFDKNNSAIKGSPMR